MKTPLLYLLACLLLLASACRKDKLGAGSSADLSLRYFVLPKTDQYISVNYLQGNTIHEVASFPLNERPRYTLQGNRLAILNGKTQELNLFDLETEEVFQTRLPGEFRATAMVLNDGQLFVGGRLFNSELLQYQISTNTWHNLEVPQEVTLPWKNVDDFVFHEDQLVVIDNYVSPKFLVYYELNSEAPSTYLDHYELVSNGLSESIHKGQSTDQYLAILSHTASRPIVRSHITLYKWADRNQLFTLSSDAIDEKQFNDFLLHDRQIVFTGRIRGLGRINVQDSFFVDRNSSEGSHQITPPEGAVTFEPIPDIVKLTAVLNSDRFIVTTRASNGKYTHSVKVF